MEVISTGDSGWWLVKNTENKSGWVPADYLIALDTDNEINIDQSQAGSDFLTTQK